MVACENSVTPAPMGASILIRLDGDWREAYRLGQQLYRLRERLEIDSHKIGYSFYEGEIEYWAPLPTIAVHNPNCPYESHSADCNCQGVGGDR